jgi:sugar transferase EpsL
VRSALLKRLTDVAIAGVGLGLCAPLGAGLALLVRWKLGSPALFKQERPGRHGRPFQIYKFRTMRDAVDAQGVPLPDHLRLTPLGRWLRASSLDELPELWNVLKGDMSLVGPRPLLMEYLARYSPEQRRRHDVPPGVTGWAQINGRNALTWEEKFELDCWYVDHWTNELDLSILFKTFSAVVRREGISHGAEATMPRFTGQVGSQPAG